MAEILIMTKVLLVVGLLILVFALWVYSREFRSAYKDAFQYHLAHSSASKGELLTEEDIQQLPVIVQKYVRYTGSVGKPKIHNYRVEFKGGIRGKPDEAFMPLTSVQYNFVDPPARLFYIEAKKMGIPAFGLHLYQDQHATFRIRVAGLVEVVNARGDKMDQGETVTLFNDMCVMAPATLISKNIQWETVDSLTVHARYTNGPITIGATLFFRESGELINFISNDRYETDGKAYHNYPWKTPISEYREINGYRLPSKAKLVYQYPGEDFCYGEFELVDIAYNAEKFW